MTDVKEINLAAAFAETLFDEIRPELRVAEALWIAELTDEEMEHLTAGQVIPAAAFVSERVLASPDDFSTEYKMNQQELIQALREKAQSILQSRDTI